VAGGYGFSGTGPLELPWGVWNRLGTTGGDKKQDWQAVASLGSPQTAVCFVRGVLTGTSHPGQPDNCSINDRIQWDWSRREVFELNCVH